MDHVIDWIDENCGPDCNHDEPDDNKDDPVDPDDIPIPDDYADPTTLKPFDDDF